MFRALKEMKAIEAETADRAESAAPLGSFSPPPVGRPLPPSPMPAPVPPGSRFGGEEGSTFIPMAIGRAEKAPY